MPIFQIKNKKAKRIPINSNYFQGEKELHDFFEENLEELLGVRLLEHKYDTQMVGVPDTLALDEANNPVIIEYKLEQDPAVLVQGISYFSWIKSQRKHFELLVHNKFPKDLVVNWNNPRVILVARGFDDRTKEAAQEVGFIELYEYKSYAQDILYLETIYSPNKTKSLKKKEKETSVVAYDINYHLRKSVPEINEAFYKLQEKIKELPNVDEIINQKVGITYRTTKSFIRFEFGKSYIDILLREAKYNDPKGLVKDITSFEWGYKGQAKLKSIEDIDYIFSLIKQSYEQTL